MNPANDNRNTQKPHLYRNLYCKYCNKRGHEFANCRKREEKDKKIKEPLVFNYESWPTLSNNIIDIEECENVLKSVDTVAKITTAPQQE